MTAGEQKNDWFAIGAYALVAAVSQLLWLTYAPITTDSAHALGVSEDLIGLLAEIFPLVYVLLAIPAALLLDRWLRPTLVLATGLMFAGALIRVVEIDFATAVAGQLMIAVAQPAVLAAVTKVAAERAAPESRPEAIAIGSAGIFLGILLSFILGATVGAANGLQTLLLINLGFAAAAFLLIAQALRRPAPHEDEDLVAVSLGQLRKIYTDPLYSRLAILVFLGMGVFNGVATWLEVLLKPAGVSADTAGAMLVVLTVAGIVSAVAVAPGVATRSAESRYLQLAGVAGAVCFATLAVTDAVPVAFAALGVLGFFLLAAQPVILELSERKSGAATAASVAGAIFLAGNLGGIIVAVGVQTVNHRPTVAFLVLAVLMLVIAPVARTLPKISARAA
jgi:predicted MFS family arabinose efflux permease